MVEDVCVKRGRADVGGACAEGPRQERLRAYLFSFLRNRNRPRLLTGRPWVRVRFDEVEIPLKRMKKSKNARRKLFPFFGDTGKEPPGLSIGIRLGCGLRGRARLSGRAGDPETHEKKIQALAQGVKNVHGNFPFRSIRIELERFDPGCRFQSWSGYFFFAVGAGAGGGCSPRRISTAAGGRGLSALASNWLTCHIWVSESVAL